MGWMDITDKQKPLGKKVNPGMFAIEHSFHPSWFKVSCLGVVAYLNNSDDVSTG